MKVVFMFVFALVVPGSAARAQGPASPLDELFEDESLFRVEEVVVTAARREQRIGEGAVGAEVMTREDMRARGADDVAEALRHVNGIDVVSSFRGDAAHVRGLDADYLLVLVDGERLVGRSGGAIDLSRIRTENVERIEIVRGPQSALYGSDAIAGVVNIVTRRAREPFEGEVHASAGAMGALDGGASGGLLAEASAAGGARMSRGSIALEAGVHHGDAFDLAPEDEATSGAAYDEWNVGGRGTWEPSDRIVVGGRVAYRRRSETAVDQSARATFDRSQSSEELQASLVPEVDLGSLGELSLRGWFTLYRDQLLQDQRGSNSLDSYEDNREHLGQLTIQWSAPLADDHRLTVGYEAMVQTLAGERVSGSGRRARLALYAQHEWTVLEEPYVLLVPGARIDVDTQYGAHPTPKLALRVDPVEDVLVLRASVGLGYREPSFKELLLLFENPSAGYVIMGNPDLEPETSVGFEAGVEWLPTKAWQLALTLFRIDIDNLIVAESLGAVMGRTQFQYVNVASAHTQGIEAAAEWEVLDGLALQAGYAFTDTEDEENDRELEGRARHRGKLGVAAEHESSGLSGTVLGTLVGPRPFYVDPDGDGVETTERADPYVSLDARVAIELSDHLSIFAGVDNALGAGGPNLTVRPRTIYGGATARY